GAQSVGITSAASAPEDLVQELVGLLQARNPGLEVIEEGEEEKVRFRQPQPQPPQVVLGEFYQGKMVVGDGPDSERAL
ncbi:MAG: hypothetical protein ACK4G4_12435, partial [Thermus sp.]